MVAGVFEELARERPKNHFTVGIVDDVTRTSLRYEAGLDIEPPQTVRAVFYGLGSDGTVGANKASIKIIGEEDGPRAGLLRLRLEEVGGDDHQPPALRARADPLSYLVRQAGFVGCTSSSSWSARTCSTSPRRGGGAAERPASS